LRLIFAKSFFEGLRQKIQRIFIAIPS